MRIGFEQAGCECVFSSEIDRHAQDTYEANFDDRPAGDIRKVSNYEIPSHDILVGGFPCQTFSIAGVSKLSSMGREHGLIDQARGTLFYEISRILDHHRPKAFLLENVKGLISHGNPLHTIEGLGEKRKAALLARFGSRRKAADASEEELQATRGVGPVLAKRIRNSRTFPKIIQILESLGYNVSYKVISAAGFVPQRRERVFIVGFLDDIDFVFPDPPSGRPKLSDILEEKVDPKYTLNDHLWNYHQERKKMQKEKGNGFGYRIFTENCSSGTLSARYYKDGAEILLQQSEGNPRKLTPRECARLMGFPDDFKLNDSEVQAYKQLGNAVVPPLISMLAESMIEAINHRTVS